VERVAARARIALDEERFEGRAGRGIVAGREVCLLLPGTWMNGSGTAVAAAQRGLGIEDPAELLVVLDDVDLPLGRLRVRAQGSDGGHRGLSDVLERLGRDDVPRLRFGVGRPDQPRDTSQWVLERFRPEERAALEDAVERAAGAVECVVGEGVAAAMNRFNAAPPLP
jgi:PTH1 family peptidyl-tRNA hydrolase